MSRLPALTALAAAVALLAMALPRLGGELLALDGRRVVLDSRGLAGTDPAAAADAIEGLETAVAAFADPRLSLEIGYLALAAQEVRDPAVRAVATAATVRGLAVAPAQPSAWARLAFLRLHDGNPEAAARALRMSMVTGRVVPALQVDRARLGLTLLPWLDGEGRSLLARDIRSAWVLHPVELAAAIPASGAGFAARALAELSAAEQALFQRIHPRY